MMTRTTFLLPEAVAALLSETIRATIGDMRVAGVLLHNAPPTPRPRDEGESDVEYATRAFRNLLPTSSDSADAWSFRTTYGWTSTEMREIRRLLLAARRMLHKLASDVQVGQGTLVAHAEQIDRLVPQWVP